MNTPTNRRQFLASLATAAVAVPVAAALPAIATQPAPVPPRTSVPLRWEIKRDHNFPGIDARGYAGPVRVADYYEGIDGQYWAHFECGVQRPTLAIGAFESEGAARAAIQAQWDQLCGAEPAPVVEPISVPPTAPKVKELEWIDFARPNESPNIRCQHPIGFWAALGRWPNGSWQMLSSACEVKDYPTLAEAKAAGQAHWEKMVKGVFV